MRQIPPINLIVHMPRTAESKTELAKRVAFVHADAVIQRLKTQRCPTKQKQELLDAIIETAKEKNRE